MKPTSIHRYFLISWLIPVVSALVGSCLLALGLSYLDYVNQREFDLSRMAESAPTIERRVAAEILLKDMGALGPVVAQLRTEYDLKSLQVVSADLELPRNSSRSLFYKTVIQGIESNRAILLERSASAFVSFIQLRHFILALLPMGLLAAVGFFLQRRYLRRHLIDPVEALADTLVDSKRIDENWPTEVREISAKLSEAFSEREQAVFGKVARGIMHDIRTHLHSIHTATQLTEAASDDEQRFQRKGKLLAACVRNIPKIKEIVDLSLDTSREIVLKPREADISKTIDQAISILDEIAKAKGVTLTKEVSGPLFSVHDPVQLERAFTNIIKNAIEAVDEASGQKVVSVKAIQNENEVRIVFEDTGLGISDLESIVRPLKSTKLHGTGLGLFVSRKILEAHAGTLKAGRSDDFGGAKFIVTLPAVEVRT